MFAKQMVLAIVVQLSCVGNEHQLVDPRVPKVSIRGGQGYLEGKRPSEILLGAQLCSSHQLKTACGLLSCPGLHRAFITLYTASLDRS